MEAIERWKGDSCGLTGGCHGQGEPRDGQQPLGRVAVEQTWFAGSNQERIGRCPVASRVQQGGRLVWLGTGNGEIQSESLLAFRDALCVPLRAGGEPFGALHVYRDGQQLKVLVPVFRVESLPPGQLIAAPSPRGPHEDQ